MSMQREGYAYKVGDYIDILNHNSSTWTIRLIEDMSEDGFLKITQPKISNFRHTEQVSYRSQKIRPFRSETRPKGPQYIVAYGLRFKTINQQAYQKNSKELDEFDFTLAGKDAYSIIQLLRGRHYYFMETLLSTQADGEDSYSQILEYFKKHLTFVSRFFQQVDFQQFTTDPYSSPMSALCSSFPELMEMTYSCLGLSQDFDVFRKENIRYMSRGDLDHLRQEWVENELLPTLISAKLTYFPINLIQSLFDLFLCLLKKSIITKSQPLSTLFEALYKNLLQIARRSLNDRKEIASFLDQAESIFRIFPQEVVQDPSSLVSSQTVKLDSDQDVKMEEDRSPRETGLTGQEWVRAKKIEMRKNILQILLQRGLLQDFGREMGNCVSLIAKECEQMMYRDFSKQQNWPMSCRGILRYIRDAGLLKECLKLNSMSLESIKPIFMKVSIFMPKEVIDTIINADKVAFLKFLIGKFTQQTFKDVLELLSAREPEGKNLKEYIDTFMYFQKWIINSCSFREETIRSCRKCLLEKIYYWAGQMLITDAGISEYCVGISEGIKNEVFLDYAKNIALPNINGEISNIFYEAIVSRYCGKQNVDLPTFCELCKFLIIENFPENRYDRRRTTILYILNTKFKENKSEYLEYLSNFLDFYQGRKPEKRRSWQGGSLVPRGSQNSFYLIFPTVEYCESNLKKLLPHLQSEFDVELFRVLLMRLNELQGRIKVNDLGYIEEVYSVPRYFQVYFKSFYSQYRERIFKFLQEEIEGYFKEANETVYSDMLKLFLDVILDSCFAMKETVSIFQRLKLRLMITSRLTQRSPVPPRDQIKIEFKNVGAAMRQAYNLERHRGDRVRTFLLEEERRRINFEMDLRFSDTFQYIRLRLAKEFNREPQEIAIYAKGVPLSEDRLGQKILDYALEQGYSEKSIPYQRIVIEFDLGAKRTPLVQHIVDRIIDVLKLMSTTHPIFKGVDLFLEDWGSNYNLKYLRDTFIQILQRGEIPQYYHNSTMLNFLLDFYMQLEVNPNYDYTCLFSILKYPITLEDIFRNIKILYIIQRSGADVSEYRQKLILYLIPGQMHEQGREKDLEELVHGAAYACLNQLAYEMLSASGEDILEFFFGFNLHRLTQTEMILQNYKIIWKRLWDVTPLAKKQIFLDSFEQQIYQNPQNWEHFTDIFNQSIKPEEQQLYQCLMGRIIKLLVSLDGKSLSLFENNMLNSLIKLLCLLLTNNISNSAIFSSELLLFMVHKIYDVTDSRDHFMSILRYVMAQSYNRSYLLTFFQKETKQKEWQNKTVLQKPRKKQYQQQQKHLVGLKNPHSICYVNSFLQQLYHIQQFRQQLLATQWIENPVPEQDLILQLKKIFIHLREQREPYINLDFYKAFKNIDGEDTSLEVQMDVDEFRNVLLDRVEKLLPKENNFVQRLFNGKLTSLIRSTQCSHQSRKQQDFSSFCLDVKGFDSLEVSLQSYFKPQVLQGDNAYQCQECKRKVRAQKTLEVKDYPPYLTFVLKRFEYTSHRRIKLNSYFRFPLDVFKSFENHIYRLKGIIIHQGVSEAGHYISMVKHNGSWYEFNDNYVNQVKEEQVMESTFGNSPQMAQNIISLMSKNAYLLIYEKEGQPQIQENEERVCHGMEQQIKRIRRTRALTDKQKIYFQGCFLNLLNQLCYDHKDPQCLHMLVLALTTIFFRFQDDITYQSTLYESFKILSANRSSIPSIWLEGLYEKVIQYLDGVGQPKYKSVLVDLLVANCHKMDAKVENLLDDLVNKIYRQGRDLSAYFYLMYGLGMKFDEVIGILNQKRLVGRILDVTFVGIIGEKMREDLRKTGTNLFQGPVKVNKEMQKPDFRFHKWQLMHLMLKRVTKLTEVQRQYFLFQTVTMSFRALMDECTTKTATNHMARVLCLLVQRDRQYCSKLMNYIGETILREKSQDLRKYLRILKAILLIEDELRSERLRAGVAIFSKALKKYSQERIDNSLDYAWQWFLKIADKNPPFRRKIRQFSNVFQFLEKIGQHSFYNYRVDNFKLDRTKNRLHGLRFASSQSQFESILEARLEKTRKLLHETEEEEEEVQDSWDSDGDLTEEPLEQGRLILRYDDNMLRYDPYNVECTIGDIIVLGCMGERKEVAVQRGNERLAPYIEVRVVVSSDESRQDQSDFSSRRS